MMQELLDYFLWPKKTGYDVPKTFAYGIILVIAIYLIFKILKKLKIKIDRRLAVAIAPYVVWGAVLRVLQDAGILNSYIFVTPGIYFFVFIIIFSTILISLLFERKKGIPYFKPVFVIGILLVAFTLPFLSFVNTYGLLLTIGFFLPWPLLFYFFIKKWNLTNRIVTTIHMFDASTTAVALNYFGYYEQHILPTYVISILGPFSFIPLKLITIVAVLFLIDRFSDEKDREFNNYLKLCIGILGGATGTRDFIGLLSLI